MNKQITKEVKETKEVSEQTILTPDSLVTNKKMDIRDIEFKYNMFSLLHLIFGTAYAAYKHKNPKTRLTIGSGGGNLIIFELLRDKKGSETGGGSHLSDISTNLLIDMCKPELQTSTLLDNSKQPNWFITNEPMINHILIPYFLDAFEVVEKQLKSKK